MLVANCEQKVNSDWPVNDTVVLPALLKSTGKYWEAAIKFILKQNFWNWVTFK